MTPNPKIPISVFLILLIGTIAVVCAASLNQPIKVQRVEVIKEVRVPMTIGEIQQFLNDTKDERYYCGKVDGKAGKKFQRAMDNWACDQYATVEFKRAEK